MARMNKFMLYINDWRSGTMGLKKRAKGCYIDLLCVYYENGGPIPFGDGDKAELCEKLNYKNIRSMDYDLDLLFKAGKIHVMETDQGPVLVNGKSDIEITKYEAMKNGRTEGGKNGKPNTKNPRSEPVDNSQETVSRRYGDDIASISSPYRVENDIENEQNQRVSGNSSNSLLFTTTTAHAHVRGPVLVEPIQPQAPAFPEMAPEMAEDPADAPAPRALVSKIPTSAPRQTRDKPCAIDPYIGPNAFNRVKPVPDEGTPEWDAYQRKQHRLAVTAEVKRIMVEAGVWNESDDPDSSFIGGWIASGADPELHIYPVIRTKSGRLAEKGDRVWGLGIFTTDIGKKIKREKEIAANPGVFAEAERQSEARYGKAAQSSSPVSPSVMQTIKTARQNNWTELHDQMVNLLTPANAGDEQSLRLLNDLHDKHREDVRERYSDWCARRNSSAA